MTHSLFERLHAWLDLFAKRDDIEVEERNVGAPTELHGRFPDDAREFASGAGQFRFSYRMNEPDFDALDDEELEELLEECTGHLFLDLLGHQEPAYMLVDGKEVDPESMYIADCDGLGTGLAAWYVLSDTPEIVWDVETLERFSSLTEYLTEGAKRAFAYNPCWQTMRGAVEPVALGRFSVPRTTPISELRELLVAGGAAPAMADDLIEWLGADVCLLFAAEE